MRSTYSKPIKCCICGNQTIERHNAQPIMTGECCTGCNETRVIPSRIVMMTKTRQIRAYISEHGRASARVMFEAEIKAIQSAFELPAPQNKAIKEDR